MTPLAHTRLRTGLYLLVAAIMLAPYVTTTVVNSLDEFTDLSHGLRVARGQVPYRDFFDLIAPLGRWLLGAVFSVAGPSLLAARLTLVVLLLGSCWLAYRQLRRLDVGPWLAMLPGWLFASVAFGRLPAFNHHWVAVPCWLLAMEGAMAGLAADRARWWWLAGAGTGLAVLGLQSDGFTMAIALGAILLLGPLLGTTSWRQVARRLAHVAGGFVLVLAPAVAFLALQHALVPAYQDIWRWPLEHYRTKGGVNDVKYLTDISVITTVISNWVNLPFWYVRTFCFLGILLVPPLLLLLAAGWALDLARLRLLAGRRWSEREERLALLMLFMVGCTLLATRGRADSIHVAIYLLPTLMVAAVAADRWSRRLQGDGLGLLRWLPQAGLMAWLGSGLVVNVQHMHANPAGWWPPPNPDAVHRATPAMQYLLSHGRPGDRIVAFPFGDIFYFYTWPPASSYSEMLPPEDGYHTEEEYHAFWQEMLRNQPRFIIFQPFLPEEQVHASYFRYPLPGYHLVQVLASPLTVGALAHQAYIYERER